jgi:hypothetical protein
LLEAVSTQLLYYGWKYEVVSANLITASGIEPEMFRLARLLLNNSTNTKVIEEWRLLGCYAVRFL